MKSLLLALLLAQDPTIDRLISDLGADQVEVRDKVAQTLVDLGEAAEQALRLRLPSLSLDAKAHANEVLQRIAAERERRKYLPLLRRVSIDARDRALGDAAAELGLPIEGPRDRKVTLALAEAPPLQAIDALAAAAGLRWAPDPALPPWEWTDAHPRFKPLYVLKKGVEPPAP